MTPETIKPFTDNWAYIKVELNWLDRLLQMAVAKQQKETKAIERVARTKADRATSHWWKGLIALEGEMYYDSPSDHASSSAGEQRVSYYKQLEARIQRSHQEGIHLGLPILRDRLRLSRFEKNLILLSLAPEVNTRHAKIYALLQQEDRIDLPRVNLCLRLFCSNDTEWRTAWTQLAGASPLVRHGLIHLLSYQEEPLLNRRIKLADPLVRYLLSETPAWEMLEPTLNLAVAGEPTPALAITPTWSAPIQDTSLTYLHTEPVHTTWSDLCLPDALMTRLKGMVAALSVAPTPEGAIVPLQSVGQHFLLTGARGTGKTLAAQALATALQVPLHWLDLATLPAQSAEWMLAELLQQQPKVLLIRSAHHWLGRTSPLVKEDLLFWWHQRQHLPCLTLWHGETRTTVRLFWQSLMDGIIQLPMPDAWTRQVLWQRAFSGVVPIAKKLDWDSLAQVESLTGGDIQAIARMAETLVLAQSDPAVTLAHIYQSGQTWLSQLELTVLQSTQGTKPNFSSLVSHRKRSISGRRKPKLKVKKAH